MQSTRKLANEFYGDILYDAERAGEQRLWAVMAEVALMDLWFMLTVVCGRDDMNDRPEINPDWLYERCLEVQAGPDGYLDLWSREHYKSTIITFGKTLQDLAGDGELTFGLFSVKRELAQGFLKQIMTELETNSFFPLLWPKVFYLDPKRESPKWGIESGIRVKRKSNKKEETVEAWGLIDGMPTSKHFDILLYDDVVTEKSVTNYDQLTKAFNALRLSLNLGSHGGRRRMIGTRYNLGDAWGSALKAGTAKPRIYPGTINGKPNGKSVFLRQDIMDEKRRDLGPYIFACQILQDPVADEAQGFSRSWLRVWQPKPEYWKRMNVYVVVDPASGRKARQNGNDYTVMWVIGLGEDQRYYLIDGLRDRLNLTARAKKLIQLVRTYQPIAIGYEEVGMQADREHIEYEQGIINFHFDIKPLNRSGDKNDFIRKLIPIFEQGRFFTPANIPYRDAQGAHRDIMREFEDEEFIPFPAIPFDDMLDNMANITHPALGAVFPDPVEAIKVRGGYPNSGDILNTSDGVTNYDPLAGR